MPITQSTNTSIFSLWNDKKLFTKNTIYIKTIQFIIHKGNISVLIFFPKLLCALSDVIYFKLAYTVTLFVKCRLTVLSSWLNTKMAEKTLSLQETCNSMSVIKIRQGLHLNVLSSQVVSTLKKRWLALADALVTLFIKISERIIYSCHSILQTPQRLSLSGLSRYTLPNRRRN